jgi:uncharacterized RDD family membrane protein YckC
MEGNEVKDNEKVLCKARSKLSLPHKKHEEADCIVTQNHLVIETEQPTRIPLYRIEDYRIHAHTIEDFSHSTVALRYFDDLNQKQRLSLEMANSDAASFYHELELAILKAKAQWLESLPIEKRYAGLWPRFKAVVADGFILGIINSIIAFLPFQGAETVISIIGIMYYIGFWAWKGATLGKMIAGVKIVATDGSSIGVRRAILRFIGYIVSAIILGLGFLMIAWDEKKQGLHDKIANTLVIRVP